MNFRMNATGYYDDNFVTSTVVVYGGYHNDVYFLIVFVLYLLSVAKKGNHVFQKSSSVVIYVKIAPKVHFKNV